MLNKHYTIIKFFLKNVYRVYCFFNLLNTISRSSLNASSCCLILSSSCWSIGCCCSSIFFKSFLSLNSVPMKYPQGMIIKAKAGNRFCFILVNIFFFREKEKVSSRHAAKGFYFFFLIF
ncbi:hypothetical protein EDC96DRAFT_531345 [Choanephora cucurbitarum]|nr:hypothetical protein EDC96DRAFT_531345 [Choanephora cucurbitarum]